MSIIERLFRVGKAKANTIVDKLEDPIEMSQQILRELNQKLQEGIESEAQIKAIAMGHRAEQKNYLDQAEEWKNKTYMLLDKAEAATDEAIKANLNNLAAQAAQNNKDFQNKANQSGANADREDAALKAMDQKLKFLKDNIEKTKNDVEIIRSQQKTAEASEKINKAMSSVDTDGLVQSMSRMKEKVMETEFKAQAYAEVDNQTLSTQQEIDKILAVDSPTSALEELKKQRVK